MNDMTDPDAKAKLDALFEKAAATYEEANGDTTKAICRALLSLCNEFGHPIDGESVILDNAAGPGILTGQLIKSLSPSKLPKIFATDFSAAMIRVLDAKGWTDKYGVRTAIMDAQDLKFQNDVFTHSFMNLGIFLIPDPEQGAKEIFRTLRSGGIALTTSIKVTGWLPPFQKAQERIRPGQKVFQGMLPEKSSEASYLKSVMEAGGFAPENVDVRTAFAPIEMVNFRSEQAGISTMVSAMITSGWSEDEKAGFAAALEEELEREIEMEKTGAQRHMGVWIAVAKK